jgi:hypothetical protein
MDAEDPCSRDLMKMEGVKRWIAADSAILTGYQVLSEAVDLQGLADSWET